MKVHLSIILACSFFSSMAGGSEVFICSDKFDPESCEVKKETSSPIFSKGKAGQVLMYDESGNLIAQSLPEKPAQSSITVYKCPNGVNPALPGGHWGHYGCMGQITTASTCTNIHFPHYQHRECEKLGELNIF